MELLGLIQECDGGGVPRMVALRDVFFCDFMEKYGYLVVMRLWEVWFWLFCSEMLVMMLG